jgi:FkbM family methyltransferase
MRIDFISKYFSPQRVLDIGANVGQFHQLFKTWYPSSYVYSVEASKDCEEYLKKITEDYYIGLLAKNEDEYDFHIIPHDPLCTGMSLYKENTQMWNHYSTTVKKKGITLDKLFENQLFDLIKIDVQGAEIDVMKGGKNLCQKAKGILLEVSLTQYNSNAPLYDEVISYMESINFKAVEVLDINKNEKLHQQDILFINQKKQTNE